MVKAVIDIELMNTVLSFIAENHKYSEVHQLIKAVEQNSVLMKVAPGEEGEVLERMTEEEIKEFYESQQNVEH